MKRQLKKRPDDTLNYIPGLNTNPASHPATLVLLARKHSRARQTHPGKRAKR